MHVDRSATSHLKLNSFGSDFSAAVVGASGGLGAAMVKALKQTGSAKHVFALSRKTQHGRVPDAHQITIDIEAEDSIQQAASTIGAVAGELHLVIVATGVLHDGAQLRPEKTWRSLDAGALERAFRINAVGPALVAKHFLPLLAREPKSAFAALSARVGSISDNHLGGWHSYRASKAALNMLIRTMSIELNRVNPQAICIGLHPGTVDTRLSKPFQSGVREGKLFSPDFAAERLLTVIDGVTPDGSGLVYAWDGSVIPF